MKYSLRATCSVGAAQGLAARVVDGAAVQAGAEDARVHPVDGGVAQGVEHACRNVRPSGRANTVSDLPVGSDVRRFMAFIY